MLQKTTLEIKGSWGDGTWRHYDSPEFHESHFLSEKKQKHDMFSQNMYVGA